MAFDKKQWSKEYYKKNKDRILARNKKWNKAHPEVMASIAKEWTKRNPEKSKQLSREYYKKYPERRKAQWRKWRETHKEYRKKYIREYFQRNPSAQHRYKVKMAEGKFTPKEWLELKMKFKDRCARCEKKEKLTVDHIIPLSKGGTNYISNIQPLCVSCNCSKHTSIDK